MFEKLKKIIATYLSRIILSCFRFSLISCRICKSFRRFLHSQAYLSEISLIALFSALNSYNYLSYSLTTIQKLSISVLSCACVFKWLSILFSYSFSFLLFSSFNKLYRCSKFVNKKFKSWQSFSFYFSSVISYLS